MTSRQHHKAVIPDLRNNSLDRLVKLYSFVAERRLSLYQTQCMEASCRVTGSSNMLGPIRGARSGGQSRFAHWQRKRCRSSDGENRQRTPAEGQLRAKDSTGPAEQGPARDPRGNWPDLIAFVAVLATGVALVLIGHVSTTGLTTECVALGGLFGIWLGFRRPPPR
jgi:hypothetical protein